jgi:hypothetical protein
MRTTTGTGWNSAAALGSAGSNAAADDSTIAAGTQSSTRALQVGVVTRWHLAGIAAGLARSAATLGQQSAAAS